jgi:hypothetical protein
MTARLTAGSARRLRRFSRVSAYSCPIREVPERHVLVVGDVRRHFVWALAEAVGQVTVCDFIHRYGVAAETMWLESPERFALRDVPAGRVRACDVRVLDDVTITATIAGSGANASLADAAVLMPWTDDLSLGDQGALLRLLPRQLRPGGVIVTTVARSTRRSARRTRTGESNASRRLAWHTGTRACRRHRHVDE